MECVKLGIIGYGVMGKCIVAGLLDSLTLKPHQIKATVAEGEQIPDSAPITISHDNPITMDWANIVILW
jgi:pyrroline-5-carboxylate reductase